MAAADSPDPAGEPTTKQEIRGWYAIDWSNSLYATVGIGGFLLLQIQYSALAAAGYPQVCPNVITNTTVLKQLGFNASLVDSGEVTSAYFLGQDERLPGSACPSKVKVPCINAYCPGLPNTVNDCREANGNTAYKLSIAGTSVDPTSYATLSLALSVAVQVVIFILFASSADYGYNRKRLVIWSGIVGGISSILCVLITPGLWWIGLPLTIVSNVAFGMSSVGYNSFLPLLVRAKPEVQAAARRKKGLDVETPSIKHAWGEIPPALAVAAPPPAPAPRKDSLPHSDSTAIVAASSANGYGQNHSQQVQSQGVVVGGGGSGEETLEAMELRIGSELSNIGFVWGYVAGLIGIILCVPFSFLFSELGSYQAAMVGTGLWWLIFTVLPAKWLKPRPGPPLPRGKAGRNAITALMVESAMTQWRVIKGLKALPVTWKYLVLWALSSDAVFLIGSIGGLFAASEVDWGCFSKGIGILLMFVLVPIFAMIGNLAYLKVQKTFHIKPKSLLLFSLFTASLPPIWGLVGLNPSLSFGMKTGTEMLVVACIYGTAIGSFQSYSRSTFAALVPKGQEAGLFGIYELTNKGSSALGPLVLTVIQQVTGQLRYGFIFVFVCISVPALFVWRLDVEKGARDAAAFAAAAGEAEVGKALPSVVSKDGEDPGDGSAAVRPIGPISNPMRVSTTTATVTTTEDAIAPHGIASSQGQVRRSSVPFAVAVASGAALSMDAASHYHPSPPGVASSSAIDELAPTASAAAVFGAVAADTAADSNKHSHGLALGRVQSFSSNTSADSGFGQELAALKKE